jgi:RNA polymerase sigma-70 factor (ECF subfamily)
MQDLTLENPPMQELLDRARRGDREAFDAIVRRLRSRLQGSIEKWSRLRLGPHVDVEDVLQETFLRAYRSLDRFEHKDGAGDETLVRWLAGIARHVLADLLRQAARGEATASSLEGAANGPSPSRLERREERLDRLQEALDALPPDYREVLVLSRLDGLPAEEIARRMGRTPNAVYHLIVRGLALLRERFGDTASLCLPDRPLRRGRRDHE